MVDTNLRAGFLLGQAAGRHMRDAGLRGRMLFMTSLHAYAPRNLAHYSASKAGLTMLMKELARALGPHGIRVNAIAPGSIPGGGSLADVAAMERMIPLGRTGTPEDIAGMAVALLCDRLGLCHRDHGGGGWRDGAVQLDPGARMTAQPPNA